MAKNNKPLFQSKASQAIDKISQMKFNRQRNLGFFGKAKQRANEAKFNLAKMSAIKELGKGSGVKGIEAAGKALSSIVAADTAQTIANRGQNSYKAPGLAAWTDNFSGNPDRSTGSDGQNQNSSTTELGG